MPKFTISQVFSIVMFITMMVFFFIWLVSQISDLGTVFGFRSSHTVANDIANVMTSMSASSGDVKHTVNIKPGATTTAPFDYDIKVGPNIVCVTSFRGDRAASTTDCATHPYCMDGVRTFTSSNGKIDITFEKQIADDEKYSCMTVSAGLNSASGCNDTCQKSKTL